MRNKMEKVADDILKLSGDEFPYLEDLVAFMRDNFERAIDDWQDESGIALNELEDSKKMLFKSRIIDTIQRNTVAVVESRLWPMKF